MMIKIIVIADDFTGASDAASFLAKSGLKTIMFKEVPKSLYFDTEAIVLALKTRSIKKEAAIKQISKACAFIKQINPPKIYFKYCSTFDSTKEGNIGPVLDYLLDYFEENYSILCPSLPVNKRTLKDGILYVDHIKLSETSMRNHPLNPMIDSFIPKLIKPQSKHPAYLINIGQLKDIKFIIHKYKQKVVKFYLVPDYESNEDAQAIVSAFRDTRILSGGSGLLEFLFAGHHSPVFDNNEKELKSILLCGSCSKQSRKQIDDYLARGGVGFEIDSNRLLDETLTLDRVTDFIKRQTKPVLIYTNTAGQNMNLYERDENFYKKSELLETLMADLSEYAYQNQYNNIVVAGGETSGAVNVRLNFNGFYIGDSIDPGVPILYPLNDLNIRLILKSGNFGSDDFFTKVLTA